MSVPGLDTPSAADALALGKLCLQFGRVSRATFHEDGKRPESDTDHTVMLGVMACAFAPEGLDRGLIAQYALVHDLVEAKVGDTNTAFITLKGREEKQAREDEAFKDLCEEFIESAPWMIQFITSYEHQRVPEARYVRYLDKAMPKITHILNGCATVKAMGRTREELHDAHCRQLLSLGAQYPEMDSGIRALMHDLMDLSEEAFSEGK